MICPALVREGRFREDLYYRLAVIPSACRPCASGADDILLLAQHFLERTSGTLRAAELRGLRRGGPGLALASAWPGNVRELENVVERAATLARGPLITLADLGTEFTGVTEPELGLRPTLAELEDRYIDACSRRPRATRTPPP